MWEFFFGWLPVDGKPIRFYGAFHTFCSILRFVVASATEAELGVLFLNFQEGMSFRLTLEDLGHPQPEIPSSATMLPPLVLPIIPSKSNVCGQWK
jgi:hypothetical protein